MGGQRERERERSEATAGQSKQRKLNIQTVHNNYIYIYIYIKYPVSQGASSQLKPPPPPPPPTRSGLHKCTVSTLTDRMLRVCVGRERAGGGGGGWEGGCDNPVHETLATHKQHCCGRRSSTSISRVSNVPQLLTADSEGRNPMYATMQR